MMTRLAVYFNIDSLWSLRELIYRVAPISRQHSSGFLPVELDASIEWLGASSYISIKDHLLDPHYVVHFTGSSSQIADLFSLD
jgi:hypothetical protein